MTPGISLITLSHRLHTQPTGKGLQSVLESTSPQTCSLHSGRFHQIVPLSSLHTLSHTHAHTHTHIHAHGHTHPQSQQLSLLHGSDGKESACQCGRPGFDSLGRKDPLQEGSGNLTPEFWPGESHGQRSLAGLRRLAWDRRLGKD